MFMTAHSGSVDKLLIYVYVLVSVTLDFFSSFFHPLNSPQTLQHAIK